LFKSVTYPKNHLLLKNGGYAKELLFIKEGFVRVFKQEDKKEVTQWIGSSTEFITEINSFFFNQQSRWNIQALSEVKGLALSKNDYDALHLKVENWTKIEKDFIAKCFAQAENRIYQLLSNSAEERYQAFYQHKKELFNLVPHQYIASMLGMSPETLSRIRAK
jgi:CRP/FNR family transcriptional regulator, anaerobic regulatory protein